MQQLNVRNVNDELWRAVKESAQASGRPVGELLNDILAEWLIRRTSGPPPDAAERAQRSRGILRHLVDPKRTGLEELRELRELDRQREDALMNQRGPVSGR